MLQNSLEMDEDIKEIQRSNLEKIVQNWGYIKRSIRVNDVIDHLIQEGVVPLSEWKILKEKQVLEEKKVEDLLYIIQEQTQNPEAICIFRDALIKSNYDELVSCLNIQCVSKSGKKIGFILLVIITSV